MAAKYVTGINTSDGVKKYDYNALASKPEALKNPNTLTFTGAVRECYDGSEDVVIDIPSYTLPAAGEELGGVKSGGDVTITDGVIRVNVNSLLDFLHPIGSIYMSVVATDPADLFGGTWERIKDTFLLATGDTYAAGSTGGESAHKLTTDEMPYHTHAEFFYAEGMGDLTVPGGTVRIPGETGFLFSMSETPNASRGVLGETAGVGGDPLSHNNMPPYLAVYVWKRTA